MSLGFLARRAAQRYIPRQHQRFLGSNAARGHGRNVSGLVVRVGLASGAVVGVTCLLGKGPSSVYADSDTEVETHRTRSLSSLSSLVRSYVVYSICSVPLLVDVSPTILSVLFSIPGIKQITQAVVRATFFKQFVGGDTAEDCIPILEKYRQENKGALFAYSVEVDENEAAGKSGAGSKVAQPIHKQIVQEMVHSIDVAADFEDRHVQSKDPSKGRKTWVAVKLTALLPNAQSLISFSSHLVKTRPLTPDIAFPGCPHPTDLDVLYAKSVPASSPLTEDDIVALRALHSDLVQICARAQERGVKIIVDAEYSWYQPAIDAYVLALARQFNKLPSGSAQPSSRRLDVQPLVYQTYQAYLRRTPAYLAQSLQDAKLNNYALGVKLVRGAYHPHEIAAHPSSSPSSSSSSSALRSLSISPDPHPPVRLEKRDTDECYNACARMLIGHISQDIENGGRTGFWPWSVSNAPAVPTIGVLFGTHNWDSCNRILEELVKSGLAVKYLEGHDEAYGIQEAATERLTMGQLYGMSDALTNYLIAKTRSSAPFVIKYIPYGALTEVMPYLSRRAIENKSVLGNGAAREERRRASAEIWKRLFG